MSADYRDFLPSDAWPVGQRGDADERDYGGAPVRNGKPVGTAAPSRNGQHAGPAPEANGQADAPERTEPTGSGFVFAPIDSAAFAAGDFRLSWLIRRLLVRGQPGIIGGPKKALKTSLVVDLAISLSTGTPFLGEFPINLPLRVAVLSGESGEHTLQETALRVCRARGVLLPTADCLWGFALPQLARSSDLAELSAGLKDRGVQVLLLDPLYLSLLANVGEHGLSAASMFDVGPLLMRVSKSCLCVGCTPLLIHHARKNLANNTDPLELEDLAFAGCQEFARQWLLLSRREKYEPGTGQHRLWLSAGGSIGHGGLWAVDVDEGHLDDDFSGRRWEVRVQTAGDAIQAKQNAKADEKRQTETIQRQEDESRVMAALDRIDADRQGIDKARLRTESRLSDRRFNATIERLVVNVLERVQVFKTTGNGARTRCAGFRRIADAA